jgi:hypothetical protein
MGRTRLARRDAPAAGTRWRRDRRRSGAVARSARADGREDILRQRAKMTEYWYLVTRAALATRLALADRLSPLRHRRERLRQLGRERKYDHRRAFAFRHKARHVWTDCELPVTKFRNGFVKLSNKMSKMRKVYFRHCGR